MKLTTYQLKLLGALGILTLGFIACAQTQPDEAANLRPACVTLPMYSSVIEQVMNVQPSWVPLVETENNYQYQWAIQDDSGDHALTATLTPDECVCATAASSHFNMGDGKEEIVGLLEGAAVAPVSNLDYTATWLEPKIMFSCTTASIFRRSYEAETSMNDGTTWTLACSRSANSDTYDSLYTLTVVAPGCVGVTE